jgi:hypothetical protein
MINEECDTWVANMNIPHKLFSFSVLCFITHAYPIYNESDSFSRAHNSWQNLKYSTRWIFVLRVTSDETHTKLHRTRELSPYANSHEWHFAKHIALVCAGFTVKLQSWFLKYPRNDVTCQWDACIPLANRHRHPYSKHNCSYLYATLLGKVFDHSDCLW